MDRFTVSVTAEELAWVDQRRGATSRSAFVRQLVIDEKRRSAARVDYTVGSAGAESLAESLERPAYGGTVPASGGRGVEGGWREMPVDWNPGPVPHDINAVVDSVLRVGEMVGNAISRGSISLGAPGSRPLGDADIEVNGPIDIVPKSKSARQAYRIDPGPIAPSDVRVVLSTTGGDGTQTPTPGTWLAPVGASMAELLGIKGVFNFMFLYESGGCETITGDAGDVVTKRADIVRVDARSLDNRSLVRHGRGQFAGVDTYRCDADTGKESLDCILSTRTDP